MIVGGGLALIGLGVLLWQAVAWQQRGFGPVDPQVMMRRLIPAAGMVAMGTQLIFGSFFLSFLGIVGNHLPRRESVAS